MGEPRAGGRMLSGLAAVSAICLAASVAAASDTPPRESIGPRIRGATPAVSALLADGARRSPTLAWLMRTIEATDVVVHVETTGSLPAGLDARLTFVTTAGGVRYLRVQVPLARSPRQLLSLIGHELQHALEVAEHPAVRSSEDLVTLYRMIGMQGSTHDRYDTVAARSIGRRVRAELG